MGYSSVKAFNLYAQWNLNVNILPLAAYQKIYCDYFRFEQWEEAQPYTYNFDYYSGGNILTDYQQDPSELFIKDNLFSLRYANYPRDLFMGILPSSQLGSVATINVSLVATPGASPIYGVVNQTLTDSPLNISRNDSSATEPVSFLSKHVGVIPPPTTVIREWNLPDNCRGRIS